jgi:uncharacterized protein with PQ loop repeat
MEQISLIAAVVLPFFNIPLILRVIRRKSSRDISLSWALGVWVCILLMAPSGFKSEDVVWRVFNYINTVFFTVVMLVVLRYRNGGTNASR